MKNEEKLEKRITEYVRQQGLLQKNQRLVVGVSGGADSVCLLLLLSELQALLQLQLLVVHVHHGIRQEAGGDAAYVEALCSQLKIPFFLVERNVPRLAREAGLGEEEMGRIVRYEAFEELGGSFYGGEPFSIAVAHTANDRAETCLFHLFRGSDIKGLSGISECSVTAHGVPIVRPLLCVGREEIEAYLHGREISWMEDATNHTDDYTRNKIRHHVLGYAQKEISPRAVEHINQAAEKLEELEEYLAEITDSVYHKAVREAQGKYRISLKTLEKEHILLQKRVYWRVLTQWADQRGELRAVHVEACLDLAAGETGRQMHFPYGLIAQREYEELCIYQRKEEPLETGDSDFGVDLSTFSYDGSAEIPQNPYTKWVDYDKIKQPLEIRTRRQGDYLLIKRPDGSLGRKLLKDLMITEKLPRDLRGKIPLIADGNHIVCMVGYRISEEYKITGSTKTILQIKAREKRSL